MREMMKKCIDYVNPFYGNGEIDLPTPQGLACTWHPIKALCGNTHPHAVYPFGQMSCGTYSGGYSSGYGTHKPNSNKPPEKFLEENLFGGFSHYHCSGTGAMGLYYNYAVVAPLGVTIEESFALQKIKEEVATPGYYKAELWSGTTCEVTVDEHTAYHRYSASAVAINFANDGLCKEFGEKYYSYSSDTHMEVVSDTEVYASVTMQGVKLYFYVKSMNPAKVSLWNDGKEIGEIIDLKETTDDFGTIFRGVGESIELQITFSLVGFEHAREQCGQQKDFETCKSYTEGAWELHLSRFFVEASEEEKQLFYSNLYQTLIKPSDFTGHSPLFDKNRPYVLGFETLWDQYKTQLPLIFSVYPEISEKIVSCYLDIGKTLGMLPHTLALSANYALEAVQASALPQHFLADANYRGVAIEDMEVFFKVTYEDMIRLEQKIFDEQGNPRLATHLLDFSEAQKALVKIALLENNKEYYEKFSSLKKDICGVFEKETGLLKDSYSYYEGNHWNYSFRLMEDMKERITLAGGVEKFEHLLDTFFGYENPEDKIGRFEGFNNETDMETPYAYHYIGRHDKLAEIISLSNTYLFKNTTGGIPGNNDTGGLSSLFLCNNMGLFPVSGQDLLLATTPQYKRMEVLLASGEKLVIKREGTGTVPRSLWHNGKKLDGLTMSVKSFMAGGEIRIQVEVEN